MKKTPTSMIMTPPPASIKSSIGIGVPVPVLVVVVVVVSKHSVIFSFEITLMQSPFWALSPTMVTILIPRIKRTEIGVTPR